MVAEETDRYRGAEVVARRSETANAPAARPPASDRLRSPSITAAGRRGHLGTGALLPQVILRAFGAARAAHPTAEDLQAHYHPNNLEHHVSYLWFVFQQ